MICLCKRKESTVSKDNIRLTVYWPPTKEYVTDEQYRYLAEAGIDHILGSGEETLHTPEIQEKMLSLCEKHGMSMTVHDGSFGPALIGRSDGEIAACVKKYKDHPACDGFYLQDEPFNPNIYTDSACAIKKAWHDACLHLNFLPCFSYETEARYLDQMNDWCALCRANGFDVDYLTYDLYPFGFGKGNMNRQGFLRNLRLCRDVGDYNGVKTGIYLQSVSLLNGYPAPGEDELRYEINLSLAYGFKWLSYFTWFTPINRGVEQFADGIMTDKGEKTPLYDIVKRLNASVKAVGATLIGCRTLGIYCNKGRWGERDIPTDFFVRPIDDGDYILSHLRHEHSGRNYVMVVNNDYLSPQTVGLKFDSSVREFKLLGFDDGRLYPIRSNVGMIQLELCPGGAAIIALPEDVDYMKPKAASKSANLCIDAKISCTNSLGEGGYYISSLNDGKRKPAKNIKGWRTYTSKTEADVIVDLGSEKAFNRVDIYKSHAPEFPSEIGVSVSADGAEYTEVCREYGISAEGKTAHVMRFDTESARYIKINVKDSPLGSIALCEIEVFDDGGHVSEPPTPVELYGAATVATYKKGDNIALNKPVFASSFVPDAYRQWGWALDFVNDGRTDTGFSSDVKQHDRSEAAEFVLVDLIDTFCIERIVLTALGAFPKDYRVQVSDDCRDWYDVAEAFDVEASSSQRFEYDADGYEGRYVRLFATELSCSERDGYILQVGEIDVYGKPICDKTALIYTLDDYERCGGDTGISEYRAARAASGNEYLTQSEADSYTEILSGLYTPTQAEPVAEITEPLNAEIIKEKKTVAKPPKKALLAAIAGAAVTAMAVATVVLVNNNTKKKKK